MGDYLDNNKPMGANVKRLLAIFVARIAIPDGGGLADGIALFTTPGRLSEVNRKAMGQVEQALAAMKAAPDNPYGDDDEVIAAAIVQAVEARQKQEE